MKFIKSLIVCSLVFMSFGMPKMASALEWPDAPEPATNADAMWAMIQQTPEEHGFVGFHLGHADQSQFGVKMGQPADRI